MGWLRLLDPLPPEEFWEDPEHFIRYTMSGVAHEEGHAHLLPFIERLGRALTGGDEQDIDAALEPLAAVKETFDWPLDGRDVRAWAQHIHDLGRRWLAHPEEAPPYTGERFPVRPPLPRASRFLSKQDANVVATEVMRRHADLARSWDEQEPWPQLHLYADLGRTTGRMVRADGPLDAEGHRSEEDVTGAVVVWGVLSDGQHGIEAAYPELRLDETVRGTYPDLCHVIGGFTHQDWQDRHSYLWLIYGRIAEELQEPARARVHAQLEQLLELDDDALVHAVHSLGGYALLEPTWRLREWLKRLHWRLYGLPPHSENPPLHVVPHRA